MRDIFTGEINEISVTRKTGSSASDRESDILLSRLNSMTAFDETGTAVSKGLTPDAAAADLIRRKGIPAQLKGYRYLKDAVMLAAEDAELLGAVTKELYPAVAKKNNTTASRVERNIRHAIETAWKRNTSYTAEYAFEEPEFLKYDAGISCFKTAAFKDADYEGRNLINDGLAGRKRPTNSEFIAELAEKIRCRPEN